MKVAFQRLRPAQAADRGPIEKYVGAAAAILRGGAPPPAYLLVLDDDHEYDRGIVGAYAAALRREPGTAFTVQSPRSQLRFDPSFPIAYGSRGVGLRTGLALDGALAAYARRALRLEPTCRVVDDIVVSAFLALRRGVPVRDVPGFATSRLGLVIGLEAIRMVEQGVASAEDIDRAMTLGYGFPMGPLRLTDLVGLDVRLHIAEYLAEHLPDGAHFRPPALLRAMVADGKLGKKSGQGFYTWGD